MGYVYTKLSIYMNLIMWPNYVMRKFTLVKDYVIVATTHWWDNHSTSITRWVGFNLVKQVLVALYVQYLGHQGCTKCPLEGTNLRGLWVQIDYIDNDYDYVTHVLIFIYILH